MRRQLTLALTIATLLAGCGGAVGPTDAPTDPMSSVGPEDDGGEPLAGVAAGQAALGVLEPGVAVADDAPSVDVAADAFRAGEDGEGLDAGDLVLTDPTGFAEVRWLDGALARIDSDTLFAVTTLDTEAATPVVELALEVGRVWSRLQPGSADYAVATDVGTAAVRGTAFVVTCDVTCTFGVAEGVLSVTTLLDVEVELRPGEQVTVNEVGQPGPIEPLEVDDFVLTNVEQDEDEGFAPIGPDGTPEDGDDDGRAELSRGRMDGTYDFDFVVAEDSNERGQSPGTPLPRPWTFRPDCASGPCGGDLVLGPNLTVRFEWTGRGILTSFFDRVSVPTDACPDGGFLEDFQLSVVPTAVERIDGELVVVTADAEWIGVFDPIEGCFPPGQDVQISRGPATRRG